MTADWCVSKLFRNLVPRVSHLTASWGDKMRDPGSEVDSFGVMWTETFDAISE